MKIISKPEPRPIRFECGYCGCVFEEDAVFCGTKDCKYEFDYNTKTMRKLFTFAIKCPICGKEATKVEWFDVLTTWRIDAHPESHCELPPPIFDLFG